MLSYFSDAPLIAEVLKAAFPTDAESRLVEALRDGRELRLSLVHSLRFSGKRRTTGEQVVENGTH